MTRESQVRVGVVALDDLRLAGLQTILEEAGGVLARGSGLQEALAADDLAAVLLDSACVENLPDVVAQFRRERPAVKIVVMGERFDSDEVQAVMASGAQGYVEAMANESEIGTAMQVVLKGLVWAPRKLMGRLVETEGMSYSPGEGAEKLSKHMTEREMQVLHLLMDGRTNREIAEAMGVGAVTVKAHLGRMLRKAGAKNRVDLTLKAMLGAGRSNAGVF